MTFLGVLRSDLRRALVSRRLLFAALLVYAVYIASSYYEFKYNFDTYYDVATLFVFLNYTGAYVSMLILSASVCYSASFCTDWQEKAIYLYCVRGRIKSYCAARVLACALAGGIAPVLGLWGFAATFSLRFPLLDARGGLYGNAVDGMKARPHDYSALYPVVISKNGALYFILIFYLIFLVCALYAVIGLAVSSVIPNKFVAVFSPYLLFFLESMFFNNAPFIKSINILAGNFSFGLNVFGNLLLMTLIIIFLIVLLGWFFTSMVKRRIANETN